MATIVAPPSQLPSRATTPPSSHAHLTLNTSFANASSHQPLPNKHLPYCSPGPVPSGSLPSPPNSPPSASTLEAAQTSLLHPPTSFQPVSDDPPVYALSPQNLADAVEHIAARPLPEAKYVFPWLHGLNGENHFQCAFFNARRKAARAVPQCLRAITIVKVGGDMSHSRLAGAVAPEEILEAADDMSPTSTQRAFLDIDPREGFSVRNFQIQACKLATVSDIVVYGDDQTPKEEVMSLAQSISYAQAQWQNRIVTTSAQTDRFSTFALTGTFAEIESSFPHIVSVGQDGRLTGQILDFAYQERLEMCQLSKASQIGPNVFLGPTPDPNIYEPAAMREAESQFDLLIEATDIAIIPEPDLLKRLESFLYEGRGDRKTPAKLEFPGSGSIAAHTCNMADLDRFVGFCKWIYKVTTSPGSSTQKDGDVEMNDGDRSPLRVLFHCTDGYTETTLFALAYSMYVHGISAEAAWIRLHREMGRNFFAYSTDKILLEKLQRRLLRDSPAFEQKDRCAPAPRSPWMEQMDGSLPSRILPYLYLGNLTHAQNPGLLKELGISQVLSVGEPIRWEQDDTSEWGEDKFLFIDNVQDNGVDSLTTEFDAALKFIAKAKANGTATLVHCRVGVSRSATIVIAEVMQQLGLSFPRAYCFVRARRLNVIVQPHLRFCYELLKWEELQAQKRGVRFRRELEWATIAREIALINKPYCKT